MTETIIQQGRFTSDGNSKLLSIRSDTDWMEVYNATVADDDTQTTAVGVQYYWQRGMSDASGIEYKKSDAANAAQMTTLLASGGFTLLGADDPLGPPLTGTTITKATPPVCTVANHGYSNGDDVVLSNLVNMPQIATIFFRIGNVTTNTFELTFFDTNTANFTAETGFTARRVPLSFGSVTWSNSFATVIDITLGSTTLVTTATDFVDLRYAVGDVLKLKIPAQFGSTELNGVSGKVLAFNSSTNTYTLDIDSSSFTAFAWVASSAVPMDFPNVVKVGNENTSPVNPTTNTDTLDIKLDSGVDGPAGSTDDVIFWRAGKSFSVTNE